MLTEFFSAAFENTQNTDQDSGAAAVPPQPLYNHNPASSAFPTRNEDNAIALAADNQDVGPAAFFPMQMRRVMNGQLLDAPRAPRHEYEAAGVSYNYRGDISNPKNLSADIPNDCNCSFWVRRLPPSTTVTSLLAAIRGTGRVYCTVITPPNPLRGFNTAAAKVVFFELAAARRFWDTYGSGGRFRIPFVVVGGRPAIVERNRTKVAESDLPRHVSRVVLVSGAEELLNVDEMLAEFAAKFSFEIDDIFVTTEYRPSADGPQQVCTIEFRFGSFRCQAQSAYHMISGRPGLSVRYGRDPCDQ
ncbi:hypothetical protein C8A01DRAFT_19961 [Parachaetomium inaequale]|uniref:RRM domain-containing protein n=1 Tax=Parachaetomium inaequale TaxID=2588326 RepID=A0AAN6P944_9PEZI|nr:hypothetical protein C8A01DRAFT_19961 [Parachaetomium inaequale]